MAAVQVDTKYTLTGPDGTTVTFNDPSDPNNVGMLMDVSGMDSPEVRESADDLVQQDGGIHGDFFYGRRPITLSGILLNPASAAQRNDWQDRLSRASNAMRGDALLSWQASGRPIQQVAVRRQQPLRITGAWQKQFQLALVAADPRVYSSILNTSSVTTFPPYSYLLANPTNFEDGSLGGFIGTPGGPIGLTSTLANSAVQAHGGTKSLAVTTPGGASRGGARAFFSKDLIAGQPVTCSAWIYIPTSQNMTIALQDNSLGNGITVGNGVIPANTWTQLTVTWVPTADSPNACVYIYQNTGAAAMTFFIDDIVFSPAAVSQGRSYAKKFPIVYAPAPPLGQLLINNAGNATTYPLIRIYGPGNNPSVTNFTTGQAISLTYGLSTGDWLTIDTLNHTVLLNDVTSRYSVVNFITTDWWGLLPGVNDLRVAFDTYIAGSSLRVDWRDAWL